MDSIINNSSFSYLPKDVLKNELICILWVIKAGCREPQRDIGIQ